MLTLAGGRRRVRLDPSLQRREYIGLSGTTPPRATSRAAVRPGTPLLEVNPIHIGGGGSTQTLVIGVLTEITLFKTAYI